MKAASVEFENLPSHIKSKYTKQYEEAMKIYQKEKESYRSKYPNGKKSASKRLQKKTR